MVTIRDLLRRTGDTVRMLVRTRFDATAVRRAEEERRRIAEQLELATKLSRVYVWSFDLVDGELDTARATFVNVWESLGYDQPEATVDFAGAVARIVLEEDREALRAANLAAIEGRTPTFEHEFRIRHGDGTIHWNLARGIVTRDATGKPLRFLGTSVDITDQKRVEQALRDTEERFRRIFENAGTGMALTDVEGNLVAFNETLCAFLGYAGEELARRNFRDLTLPVEAQGDLQRLRAVVRGEVPLFTRDKRYVRRDGSIVWGNITASVILRDANGAATHLLGVVQDISERKALEEQLRHAKELLEVAIRGANWSIWEYNMPDGDLRNSRETLINVWESLGYEADDAPPSVAAAVHPDDLPRLAEQIDAYLVGRTGKFETEHRVRQRDGAYRWILGRGVAMRDGAGRPVRFIGTSVDITDIKRIEAELQAAREAAEAANRAKDEFLAHVSHEIRTPMNAILTMTELAIDGANSDRQRQLLGTVRSAARSLLGIIDDLLDFSKITAGKLALDTADFSLRATVADVTRALDPRVELKGLTLDSRVSPAVPDWLSGDEGRLRQVLMNLIGNAIKFTARGRIEVVVELGVGATEATTIVFSVRDTGIGIPADKQASIFRAFEQGDASTTRKYGGTGLGLTISAQLAALMGGRIAVESAPGRGSTFVFTVPFGRPQSRDPDGVDAEIASSTTNQSPPAVTPRVLVAEDNELNIVVLRELLKRRGYRVDFAENGREALKLAITDSYDLMLLDLHMPEMDGFEVVRVVRARERESGGHLPIIALTARSLDRDRERSLAAGMDDFLSKPIEVKALWAAIDRAMTTFPPVTRTGARLLDA